MVYWSHAIVDTGSGTIDIAGQCAAQGSNPVCGLLRLHPRHSQISSSLAMVVPSKKLSNVNLSAQARQIPLTQYQAGCRTSTQ